MTDSLEDSLTEALGEVLLSAEIEGLDEDLVAYMAGLVVASEEEDVRDTLGPFFDSVECPPDLQQQALTKVKDLLLASQENEPGETISDTRKLTQGVVHMAADLTDADWSQTTSSAIKARANEAMDAHTDKASAKDKRKARKAAAAEERQKLASQNDTNVDEGEGLIGMKFQSTVSNNKSLDVLVRNVTVSLDNGTVLLDASDLQFAHPRRYGLIGENGVGKSTLLKAISQGQIDKFPSHLRVLHVRQEVPAHIPKEWTVTQAVLQSDAERNALLAQEKELLAKLESGGSSSSSTASDDTKTLAEKRQQLAAQNSDLQADLKELDAVYARLQVLGADHAESRAARILSGLQFTPLMQHQPIASLSGGWKMRVALAAALFVEPDICLLDEPTNHLDLEAVLWLEEYLQEYPHTVVVVSHDRGFLNEVCTDIIEFKRRKLTYYRGNFDNYVRLRDENIRNAMRVYQAYQAKREHMMEFITKFRANAKRATMVQSRIKAVEKMDAEAPEPVEVDAVWRFSIPNSEPLGPPILAINDVSFDYNPVKSDGSNKPESEFLLQQVNFGVSLTSKIAILGANGQGKTTLLNLIMGKLKPVKGSVSIHPSLRIGHFTQHSGDNFDLKLSALENLLNMFDEAEDLEMRSFLGRFQIQGNDALKPMMLLSGGQKSRVAFAALAYKKPHVLVIDEGSNHLSMEAVDALIEAMQDFKGGIMVVSHDQHFVSNTCSELWVVDHGHARRFRGDFNDYKAHTAEITKKRVEESLQRLNAMAS